MTDDTGRPIERELDDIAHAIDEAERRAAAGDGFDLAPLAARVEQVCHTLTRLPPARARPLADERLPPLIDAFDRLAGRLRDGIAARGGRAEATTDSRASRARAAAAYGSRPGGRRGGA